MSWLCFLSWAYFLLFSSCKPKFTIFFKFFLKKTNHFWTTPSTLFLFPVSLSSWSLRFLISLNLFVSFFSILELSFFRFRFQTVFFDYLLWFYVYFLQISLLWLQEVAYLQRALRLLKPNLWLLVLLASTFMRLVKWSLRLRAVPANSMQFFEVVDYIVPYGSSFPISTFAFKYTLVCDSCHRMNVLFLISRNDRTKLTKGKNRISLQVV